MLVRSVCTLAASGCEVITVVSFRLKGRSRETFFKKRALRSACSAYDVYTSLVSEFERTGFTTLNKSNTSGVFLTQMGAEIYDPRISLMSEVDAMFRTVCGDDAVKATTLWKSIASS